MRTTLSLLTVAALVAALGFVTPPASAEHGCNGEVTTLPTPAGTFYVDQRSQDPTVVDVWLYMESNGTPGLQSGGTSLVGGLYTDPCEHEHPDTLIT